MRPITFCSAASRIAQVLMTISSADSRLGASEQPAAARAPAISSESERFIWQPSVQTWKDGNATSSVANSASAGSAPAGAMRTGLGAMSSIGSARVLMPKGPSCGSDRRDRLQQPLGHVARNVGSGLRLRVAHPVAMVVRATSGEQTEPGGQGFHGETGRRLEAAVIDL